MKHHVFAVATACTVLSMALLSASAQPTRESLASADVLSQISMFAYREGPKSDLVLRGTPIAENALGKVTVEFEDGNAQIDASVEDLPEPATLGPYTTYVLWALTPDGRAANQGIIGGYEGGKGEIKTSYNASQFALVVTAEPHFAVSAPSTMLALYNVADDVEGQESKVTTLVERSDYSSLTAIPFNEDTNPPELLQARYAVALAESAGAARFAAAAFATATEKLSAAQTALTGKNSVRKTAPGLAREAVVAAEDARRAAMQGSAAATADAERQTAAAAAAEAAGAAERQRAEAAAAQQRTVAAAEQQRAVAAAATANRAELLRRLNAALPTRESDRGLISEIGGVQFATGTADVNASGREGLARFAGVVASYPDLRFMVEGHTDSTGSLATNNELSLRRAISVRDYLIGQGVPASSIDVKGLGPSMPIGDNTVADGRARNRRVEIVLSGGDLVAR